MNRQELLRKLKKKAKKDGVEAHFDKSEGKGGHGTYYYGDKKTTIPDDELKTGTLKAILKQLGIKKL